MSTEPELLFTGDNKRHKATFTDRVPEGDPPGPVVDPDAQAATFTVYDADEKVVMTDDAIRENTGVYYFDWTASNTPGNYFLEFKGLFNGKPKLRRKIVKVKFKGDI